VLDRIAQLRIILWGVGISLLVAVAIGDFVLISIMAKLAAVAQ
jgi:hypothetical protein